MGAQGRAGRGWAGELLCEAVDAFVAGEPVRNVVCARLIREIDGDTALYADIGKAASSVVASEHRGSSLATVSDERIVRAIQVSLTSGRNTGHKAPVLLWLPGASRRGPRWAVWLSLAPGDGHARVVAMAGRTTTPSGEQREALAVVRHALLSVEALLDRAPLPDAGVSIDAEKAWATNHETALTERESEVLGLLSTGMTARVISERLGVSPRTVHRHLGSVYRKLGAHDRLTAVNRAHEEGLLGSW